MQRTTHIEVKTELKMCTYRKFYVVFILFTANNSFTVVTLIDFTASFRWFICVDDVPNQLAKVYPENLQKKTNKK